MENAPILFATTVIAVEHTPKTANHEATKAVADAETSEANSPEPPSTDWAAALGPNPICPKLVAEEEQLLFTPASRA